MIKMEKTYKLLEEEILQAYIEIGDILNVSTEYVTKVYETGCQVFDDTSPEKLFLNTAKYYDEKFEYLHEVLAEYVIKNRKVGY